LHQLIKSSHWVSFRRGMCDRQAQGNHMINLGARSAKSGEAETRPDDHADGVALGYVLAGPNRGAIETSIEFLIGVK
jgi:hypothetical protein